MACRFPWYYLNRAHGYAWSSIYSTKGYILPKSMAVLVTGCTPDVCYCNRSSINIPMLTRKLSIVCVFALQ